MKKRSHGGLDWWEAFAVVLNSPEHPDGRATLPAAFRPNRLAEAAGLWRAGGLDDAPDGLPTDIDGHIRAVLTQLFEAPGG